MITGITAIRSGTTTAVTATSSLTGIVYFFWYQDGAFVGMTATATRLFVLAAGDQSEIDVLDSLDPAFDAVASSPDGYPARRTLFFVRSIDPNVVSYRIEQQRSGGAWAAIGAVPDDATQWSYQFLSTRLDDLTQYAWRVTPLDAAGNAGTIVSLGAETIVRTPDAPRFNASFLAGTDQVAFGAA